MSLQTSKHWICGGCWLLTIVPDLERSGTIAAEITMSVITKRTVTSGRGNERSVIPWYAILPSNLQMLLNFEENELSRSVFPF